MSDPPFPPEMRRALDQFAPPPLPADFAARAAAKAQARHGPATPPLPRLSRRWRAASPWRRAGLIASGVASFSLVSAAAAATGVFGAPVEVPVISRIAESLEIVPRPVARAVREPDRPSPVAAAPAVGAPRARLDALLDDPQFRALPPAQRRAELRRTARALIDSGEATPREVVTALRETTRERIAALPPEQRQRLAEGAQQRRNTVRERLAELPPAQRQRLEKAVAERREARGLPPLPPQEVRRQLVRERVEAMRARQLQRLEQSGRDTAPTPPGAVEPMLPAPPSEGSAPDVR
ncbi:MAG: hypothetical protein B7Z08_09360 [Sphingomonadales bacterium 32-68-7]|nr:MAG: hypothetical protein B7Z33_11995 [Sphingomonadales bacterium 12-68-11]OYX08499.1 MAG: hypothetical protein B7Z08_09360 [Sphingomonadales bacterium 32-68-7]